MFMNNFIMILIALLLYVASLCLSVSEGRKANIVLIITDDQDVQLGGQVPIKKANNLIGKKGATFVNAFTTTPICCPSRASILTGLYQHNHGVMNNSIEGQCNGLQWQKYHEINSFASKMKDVGYNTFYAGKYLNKYGYEQVGGIGHIPKGWDFWVGLVGNSKYYNYTLSVNGTRKKYNNDYLTNVILEYGLSFLDNQSNMGKPFLMVLAPPAPHQPFTPEPKYKGIFNGTRVPRNKQYNYPHNSDKHWLLRMLPSPLPKELLEELDEMYSHRWETLLSVDDLTESIIEKLEEKDIISNTYVMYTSDNGFHLGQLSLPWDKRQPYEFDIRIPLMIRGPNIKNNIVVKSPILNVDIAPTILQIAGICDESLDGISFLPIREFNRTFLIEYQGEGSKKSNVECPWRGRDLYQCTRQAYCRCQDSLNNTYVCIRGLGKSQNFVFCAFADNEEFEEYYDLHKDPFQLQNAIEELNERQLYSLRNSLYHLFRCKQHSCFKNTIEME